MADSKQVEDADANVTTNTNVNNITDVPYLPSVSTGVFGSYTIKPLAPPPPPTRPFQYRASNCTGVFGGFTIQENNTSQQNSSNSQNNFQLPPKYLETDPFWRPGNRSRGYNVNRLALWAFDDKKNTTGSKFYVCNGSVVDFSGEAIVNAANEGCLGGGGVDGAITSAGGDKLDSLRRALPIISRGVRCLTGSAVITGSGHGTRYNRLRSRYVLHAVGPSYGFHESSFVEGDKELYDSYQKCMELGKLYGIKTIGFCLISAGIFRGGQSLENVLKIGCQSIYDNIYDECEAIYLIGYTRREIGTLLAVAPKVFGKPKEIYYKTK